MREASPLEYDIPVRHRVLMVVLQHCSQWLSAAWEGLRLTQQLPKALNPSLRMEQSLVE